MSGVRLDAALVARGLVRSRAQAKELLDAGRVLVDGKAEAKASTKVSDTQNVEIEGDLDHYVGRAAHKLLAACEAFPGVATRVAGAHAIDVGASTGGFTQVLLERGAAHVVALDVGHGQLAEPVKSDPRVTDLEGVNVRDVVSATQLDGSPFALVVVVFPPIVTVTDAPSGNPSTRPDTLDRFGDREIPSKRRSE